MDWDDYLRHEAGMAKAGPPEFERDPVAESKP
jgi:hypothetical protein